MQPFIKIRDLKFAYNSSLKKLALDGLNLDINRGEFVSILGANGCGKSTLARHFNALLLPNDGKVYVNDMDTDDENNKYKIRSTVGFVMQNPENQIVASVVEEDVAFGPENLGLEPKEIIKRVKDALSIVGMYDLKDTPVFNLSGGQKQRLAIAGILAMNPECIVLDEPTSMLDPSGRKQVLNILKKLNKEKRITIILITHSMTEASLSDRTIVMENGKIIRDTKPQKLFSDVEFLKKHSLKVPKYAELIHILKKRGYDLPDNIDSIESCTLAISKLLLEGKTCR